MSSVQPPLSRDPCAGTISLDSPRRGLKRRRSQAGLDSPLAEEGAGTDMRNEIVYIPVTRSSPTPSTELDGDARSPVLLLTFAVAAFSTAAQLYAELSEVATLTHISCVLLPRDLTGSSTGSAYVTFHNADVAQDMLDTIAVCEVGIWLQTFSKFVLVALYIQIRAIAVPCSDNKHCPRCILITHQGSGTSYCENPDYEHTEQCLSAILLPRRHCLHHRIA